MDIHVDIRGFLEIHAWIFYGFSDQGPADILDILISGVQISSKVLPLGFASLSKCKNKPATLFYYSSSCYIVIKFWSSVL